MNILIVDDEKGLRLGVSRLLNREGFGTFQADNSRSALKIIEQEEIHAALLDIKLGQEDGIDLLKKILKKDKDIICLMITGYGSIGNAVEAMQAGAADYLLKPVDNNHLLEAISTRLELKKLKAENDFHRTQQLEKSLDYDFHSENSQMGLIMLLADKVKDTDSTILITGESGTGKEVLCRYIHYTSNRKEFPFVGVNCAALSETLLLSELFGHEKGSFTGAHERKMGKFELAHGGTLFLDEIGDMSIEAQAKLLRVLEDNTFERLGGNKSINVDIRVIAATNQDLQLLIKKNRFREDLYYRLNVITLSIPPLRERQEDIERLSNYFGRLFSRKFRKEFFGFDEITIEKLKKHLWRGNIRELRNLIHQAVLMNDEGKINVMGLETMQTASAIEETQQEDLLKGSLQQKIETVMEAQEKRIIQQTLEEYQYNRTAVAEALGISRKTLFNKISKYQL